VTQPEMINKTPSLICQQKKQIKKGVKTRQQQQQHKFTFD
jgi:hypothetical protein